MFKVMLIQQQCKKYNIIDKSWLIKIKLEDKKLHEIFN